MPWRDGKDAGGNEAKTSRECVARWVLHFDRVYSAFWAFFDIEKSRLANR